MKTKDTLIGLSIIQLIVAIPFNGTNIMPIFGSLSLVLSVVGLLLPPEYN